MRIPFLFKSYSFLLLKDPFTKRSLLLLAQSGHYYNCLKISYCSSLFSSQCIPIYVGEVVTSHVTKKFEKAKIFFICSPQVLRRALTFDRSTSAKIKKMSKSLFAILLLLTTNSAFGQDWKSLKVFLAFLMFFLNLVFIVNFILFNFE